MHLGMLEAFENRMEIISGIFRCLSISKCGSSPPRRRGVVQSRGSTIRGMDPELTTELKSEEAVTDERAGVFTPDKKRGTADGAGRAAFD